MFAWKSFLEARNIPYIESGRYELMVRCPFCGSSDPSQHMSISTRGRGYRCFRSQNHSGRYYVRLLSALIGCSETQARELMGEQSTLLPADGDYASSWRRQLGLQSDIVNRPKEITLPIEAKPLSHSYGIFADLFWRHLYDRGFTAEQAHYLSDKYRLHYAIKGQWAYRLIIPIYNAGGDLVTWTGRTVATAEKVRYKTLSTEQSVDSPTNLVLGLNFLWHVHNPRCLVICEGPLDAMAITVLGHTNGIWGTCLFGVQVSNAQSTLLDDLSRKFGRVRLLVDPDARMKVLSFRDRLPRSCELRELAPGLKDPGELPKYNRAEEFLSTLL